VSDSGSLGPVPKGDAVSPSDVTNSPLGALIAALARRDLDAAMALCSSDCRLATADGRRAEGRAGVGSLLASFFSDVRAATYEVTAEWHQDNVWFAEVLANYEMQDWLRLEGLPRAFVVRTDDAGICDIRVYGAHERRLADHRSGAETYRLGGQLLLPL
jgi:hypothetical protein